MLVGTFVDEALHVDMCLSFNLQVAAFGIVRIITLESAVDVDWVGIVAFDEVRVVAVHCPDQIAEAVP
ncbi:hypothetical protein RFM26_25250 [Mesorhizobium sp. VK23B]|uniref:Uncharacterized protein n=1 Tax=Mesorhizobium dulcispinae TaxID=3072316 RepID=A0ABU4XL24_9HYPH|nr:MULTISPECIES: hypothetical protein [unclassified Mesorhizobium]MDX8469018.1 hypothetical protein [Mesorhizobium sp. VK23B]MDX8475442.1 hypothetical protein [Mesorhizobium sp. VK23A]